MNNPIKKKRGKRSFQLMLCIISYFIIISTVILCFRDSFLFRKDITIRQTAVQSVIGEILDGTTVLQTFRCPSDGIYGVSLLMATFARENSGFINVEIIDIQNDHVLGSTMINTEELRDNEFADVYFPTIIRNIKGKELSLRLTSTDSFGGNAVTVYCDDSSHYYEQTLYVNGEQRPGSICYLLYGAQRKESSIIIIISFYVLGIALSFFIIKKRYKEGKYGDTK